MLGIPVAGTETGAQSLWFAGLEYSLIGKSWVREKSSLKIQREGGRDVGEKAQHVGPYRLSKLGSRHPPRAAHNCF